MPNEPQLAIESIAGQRPYQEDSVLAESLSDGRLLVAVADGMGGHAAGEVASALALETLVTALEEGKTLDVAVSVANQRVYEQARDPGKQGMGTTLTVALVDDGEYFVANVGDSRGYLLTRSGIRQLTEDHSFVAEAVKRGQSRADAEATPWRDALTRSIGTDEHVDVDVFGPFPLEPDSALLLCSDGLYKVLSDEQLQHIFTQSSSARGAAQTLVATAFESGSDDNISVAIAEYGAVPRDNARSTMQMSFVAPEDDPGDEDPESVAEQVVAVQATVDPAAGPALPGAADRDSEEGMRTDHGAVAAAAPSSEAMGPAAPIRLIVAAIAVLAVLIAAFLL